MSHVATDGTKYMDLDCLEKAAERLGLQLVRGKTTWKWYGRWMDDFDASNAGYKNGIPHDDYGKCVHAIVDPDKPEGYEIGIYHHPDGEGWLPVWANFGNPTVEQKAGGGKLKKMYKLCGYESFAEENSFSISWELDGEEIKGSIIDYS